MTPEQVTDAMVRAFYDAHHQETPEHVPYDAHRPTKDAIAAAINAMPADPELERLRAENEALRGLLRELNALVWGECPSLLNEDSGGDGRLAVAIDSALQESKL